MRPVNPQKSPTEAVFLKCSRLLHGLYPDSGGIAYGMDELHAGSTGIDTDTAASNSA